MTADSPAAPTPTYLVQHIHVLVDRERFDQARRALDDGLGRFPDNQELIYLSTYVDWAQGKLEDAEQSLQQLLRLNPKHYGGRIQLARLLVSRKDFPGAERAWLELLTEEPDNADFYGEYAELMLNAMFVNKAMQLSAEGLRHQPEHEHCLYVIALAKLVHGGRVDGNTELMTLLAHHPERVRSAHALVVALQAKGRFREAYRVSQQMLRAQPNSPEWLDNVRALRAASHWSMLPLYPFQRWGWGASIATWFAIVFFLAAIAPHASESVKLTVVGAWFAFVLYSWIWPPLLRRIL